MFFFHLNRPRIALKKRKTPSDAITASATDVKRPQKTKKENDSVTDDDQDDYMPVKKAQGRPRKRKNMNSTPSSNDVPRYEYT